MADPRFTADDVRQSYPRIKAAPPSLLAVFNEVGGGEGATQGETLLVTRTASRVLQVRPI